MPSKPTRNPRVTMHKNGLVTISGLNYKDAQAILTKATLHWYDSQDERKATYLKRTTKAGDDNYGLRACILANRDDDEIWWRHSKWLLDSLSASISECISASHGPEHTTKRDRKKAVIQRRKERLWITDFMRTFTLKRKT